MFCPFSFGADGSGPWRSSGEVLERGLRSEVLERFWSGSGARVLGVPERGSSEVADSEVFETSRRAGARFRTERVSGVVPQQAEQIGAAHGAQEPPRIRSGVLKRGSGEVLERGSGQVPGRFRSEVPE